MKTYKFIGTAVCLNFLAGIMLTSCQTDPDRVAITPRIEQQPYLSNMRCVVNNLPWIADYSGTASSLMQAQYLSNEKSLNIDGFANYGPNGALGIAFSLKDVDLAQASLYKPVKIILVNPLAGSSTVTVQVAEPTGFKYPALMGEKSFVSWQVIERGHDFVIVKGAFQIQFSESNGIMYSISQGEFDVKVTTERF